MDGAFEFLSVPFFTKAEIYPGSIGAFRYRFQRFSWPDKPDAKIQAWVYENVCFELARDIETETFPWTPEGADALREWLEQKLRERGAAPYRIPYDPPPAPDSASATDSLSGGPSASVTDFVSGGAS